MNKITKIIYEFPPSPEQIEAYENELDKYLGVAGIKVKLALRFSPLESSIAAQGEEILLREWIDRLVVFKVSADGEVESSIEIPRPWIHGMDEEGAFIKGAPSEAASIASFLRNDEENGISESQYQAVRNGIFVHLYQNM